MPPRPAEPLRTVAGGWWRRLTSCSCASCAWSDGGGSRPGALVGGAGFIIPGLVVIIALAALFLSSSPPDWVRAAGAGGGAAVAAVAVRAALDLALPSWRRAGGGARHVCWIAYVAVGLAASALAGPFVVSLAGVPAAGKRRSPIGAER